MENQPIKLDYERPDELRAARDVSPFTQALLGYLAYGLLVFSGGITALFIPRPYMITIIVLVCGMVLSIVAHYGLRWPEFAPAMGIALSLTLFVIAIAGIGWFMLMML